jgi:hypothetical protein
MVGPKLEKVSPISPKVLQFFGEVRRSLEKFGEVWRVWRVFWRKVVGSQFILQTHTIQSLSSKQLMTFLGQSINTVSCRERNRHPSLQGRNRHPSLQGFVEQHISNSCSECQGQLSKW